MEKRGSKIDVYNMMLATYVKDGKLKECGCIQEHLIRRSTKPLFQMQRAVNL